MSADLCKRLRAEAAAMRGQGHGWHQKLMGLLEEAASEVDGLREIAQTAGRLVRAANVTPMTSTNGCGLAAIGKELATLEKLLREPK